MQLRIQQSLESTFNNSNNNTLIQTVRKKPWYSCILCYENEEDLVENDHKQTLQYIEKTQQNIQWYTSGCIDKISIINKSIDKQKYEKLRMEIKKQKLPKYLQRYPILGLISCTQVNALQSHQESQLVYLYDYLLKLCDSNVFIDVFDESYVQELVNGLGSNNQYVVVHQQQQLKRRATSLTNKYELKAVQNHPPQKIKSNVDIILGSRNLMFASNSLYGADQIYVLHTDERTLRVDPLDLSLSVDQICLLINQVATYFEVIENVTVLFPCLVPIKDILEIAQLIIELYLYSQVKVTQQSNIFCNFQLVSNCFNQGLCQSLSFNIEECQGQIVHRYLCDNLVYKYLNQQRLSMVNTDIQLINHIIERLDAHSLSEVLLGIQNFEQNKIQKSDVKTFLDIFSPLLDQSFQLKHLFNQLLIRDTADASSKESQSYPTADLSQEVFRIRPHQTYQDVQQLFQIHQQNFKLQEQSRSQGKNSPHSRKFSNSDSFDVISQNDEEAQPHNVIMLNRGESDMWFIDLDRQMVRQDSLFRSSTKVSIQTRGKMKKVLSNDHSDILQLQKSEIQQTLTASIHNSQIKRKRSN